MKATIERRVWLVVTIILFVWSLSFCDVISGTVMDSITNAPLAQVKVRNSIGDSTFTAVNGTFTLSSTSKIVYHNNGVKTPENKVIQIRNMRGEMIAQFSSAKPNLPLLANGIYIVTEKADNKAPFSYTILGLSNNEISNYFVRNNSANKYSSALSKTRSITSANSLTFTKDGYQTVQKNITGSQSGLVVRMLTTAPGSAPSLISPTNAATNVATSPTLTWSTLSGSTAYGVQVSTVSSFVTIINDDSTLITGSKTVNGLTNSTTYYWRVIAINAGGTSTWSTIFRFTTVPVAPAAPTLITPANATDIAVMPTFTWNTVAGAATYRIQIATASDFSTMTIDDSTLAAGTKTLITALSGGLTYYWRVNAKNTGGTSAWSTMRSNTTITSSSNTTVTDADGNVYHTVKIGTQTWTVENLRTTKYNDSTAIPLVTDNTAWGNFTIPGYCWFNNDTATYKTTYGALYNWYAVKTGKLAPAGWHVPMDAEWDTLQNYLIAHGYNYDNTTTGNKIAKAMAAQTNWATNTNTGAIGNNLSTNNRSGFSALPGGYRTNSGGFNGVGNGGYWWSASEYTASYAFDRGLSNNFSDLNSYGYNKSYGFSVRLLRDGN
jgi:uncharacterized protein (TIGR02145 family)